MSTLSSCRLPLEGDVARVRLLAVLATLTSGELREHRRGGHWSCLTLHVRVLHVLVRLLELRGQLLQEALQAVVLIVILGAAWERLEGVDVTALAIVPTEASDVRTAILLGRGQGERVDRTDVDVLRSCTLLGGNPSANDLHREVRVDARLLTDILGRHVDASNTNHQAIGQRNVEVLVHTGNREAGWDRYSTAHPANVQLRQTKVRPVLLSEGF